MFSIRKDGECILHNGKPFFYTADTIWSAFTNLSLEDWELYLETRKSQNFNALQISILPILHDRSEDPSVILPFEANKDGGFDFSKPNQGYFTKAKQMLQMATDRGFTPVLVAIWINYVRGSWISEGFEAFAMETHEIDDYMRYIVDAFNMYNPIYCVSGDAVFDTDYIIEFYTQALGSLKKHAPTSIATYHIFPRAELHQSMIDDDNLDFYMYQSGHDIEDDAQKKCYLLAEKYRELRKRPIINGEPCYDGHGHGFSYGRFNQFDIRKASWQSILAGATAGITYGAHGIWSWQKLNSTFSNTNFSDTPFYAHHALNFQGAYDVGYIRWLIETYNLFNLTPQNNLIVDQRGGEIRLAQDTSTDTWVLYLPTTTSYAINYDFTEYNMVLHLFGEGNRLIRPSYRIEDGVTYFDMHPFNSDALLVCTKKE